MRFLDVALALVIAFVAQTVVGRYLPFLSSYLDLFTVVVAGFGLIRGRMVGLATGSVAGLVQDAFSGSLLGLNGMSKTTVGYLAGIAGRHLIVRSWSTRAVFFMVATLLDMAILALVGYAADVPVVLGEGLTPARVCLGNALAGMALVRVLDRRKGEL